MSSMLLYLIIFATEEMYGRSRNIRYITGRAKNHKWEVTVLLYT